MLVRRNLEQAAHVYTLRIELIDGKVLLYPISTKVKESLESWLFQLSDDLMEQRNLFLSFHSIADRYVFVRISCIKKLIFCVDILVPGQEYLAYHDNFKVLLEEEEPEMSELIIKIRNSSEPVVFDNLDPSTDLLGIDENSFKNFYFLKGGFLAVRDEDEDQNFIPVTNIECIEVNRVFVYPDEIWKVMQSEFGRDNSVK